MRADSLNSHREGGPHEGPEGTIIQREHTNRFLLLPVLAALFVMGAGYSNYLGRVHQTMASGDMTGAVCGGFAWLDCSKTLGSRYGDVLGLPVTVFAEAWFVALLILLLAGVCRKEPRRKHFCALFCAIVPGVLVALSYIAVSSFVLHVACVYCLGIDLLVGICAILAFRGMELTEGSWRKINEVFRQFCRIWALPLFLFAAVILAEWKSTALHVKFAAPVPEPFSSEEQLLPRMGPESAVLHIVEFVDFECLACRYSARELDRFMARNPGRVELRCVILMSSCRHEIGKMPPEAVCLSARVGSIMENRKCFWPYYRYLMLTERNIDETLVWEAVEHVLGKEQISVVRSDLGNTDLMSSLQRNISVAEKYKVIQTPCWVVNGRMETGARSEKNWGELLAHVNQ